MSSSSAVARPLWVWSLPAVAVFISFLWFRKKRGSLQTDTGGPGEPDDAKVEQVVEVSASASVTDNNNLTTLKQDSKLEVSEPTASFIEEVSKATSVVVEPKLIVEEVSKLKPVDFEDDKPKQIVEEASKVTESVIVPKPIVEEINCTAAFEAGLGSSTFASVTEVNSVVNGSATEEVQAVNNHKPTAQKLTSTPVPHQIVVEVLVKEAAPLVEASVEKENLNSGIAIETSSDTATQAEPRQKAEEPKKEEVGSNSSPGAKWSKKRREKKSDTMSNDASVEGRDEAQLEQQLAKLDLAADADPNPVPAGNKTPVVVGGERDSANTSPAEVMLASPSLSGYSDTHSEGSSDSGKGCSDVLTPSPTPVSGNSLSGDLPGDLPVHCVFEFVIPQHLVGRLIGRNGSYIHEIKDSTHASVYIKRHPDTPKLKICAIEGTQVDIDNALDMIRHKFPKKRYPNVTLEPVELAQEPPPVLPENMQLYLVEGVNNDVILSSLVSAGHFFLQQPTHPTYPSLNRLNSCMAICYAEPNLPALPDDIQPGVLCAAPVHDGWYRAEVTSFPEGEICDVKFVDYGGYMAIEKSRLRQIRADFVTLPFQAAQCFLAAVQPVGEEWSQEARELVETLTLGKVLQAQIHGYTEHSVPLIFLYTVHNNDVVSVNEELVMHGYAEWLLPEPVTEEPGVYMEATMQQPLTA